MNAIAVDGKAFSLDARVRLHGLTYLDEGEQVTVGRTDIDSYCVLPADGAALLRQLESGHTPHEAAAWYEKTYGEPVDVVEFLTAMDELELIRTGDEAPTVQPEVRWQRFGQLAFSRPALVGCAALLMTAAALMIRDDRLAPHYRHVFFTESMVVMELTLFLGQFPLILLHEGAHALAGRRLGLRSSLSVSRRLYFIVFETSLDGLVTVPRRRRYLPMLAGILLDALVVAILTMVAAMLRRPDATLPVAGEVCLAFAFSTVLRIVWQFYFYLETDIYQVIVTVLGCNNLQTTAKQTLANRFWRLLRRPDRTLAASAWHPRDQSVAQWYSWLVLAGYAFSLGALVAWGLPAMRRVLGTVIRRFSDDGATPLQITDSVVFSTLR